MNYFFYKHKTTIIALMLAILGALAGSAITIGVNINLNEGEEAATEPTATFSIELSEEQVPAMIEDDQGDLVEDSNIPTVEEIDGGGLFEDIDTGVSALTTDVYNDLGAIENVETSSVEAFKRSVMGRCIIANNIYGAQCVSLARAFWWSYAGFDVSTCGTGLAKGMMGCAAQNAGDRFKIIWNASDIQAGTWIITGGSYTGHVCMALGPVNNGYVACLGENQGGASCGVGVGGSAANVVNLSAKNFIGGYTPLDYIAPEPEPEPEATPEADPCSAIEVKTGDTMGAIMKRCEGEVKWGDAMDAYADGWVSELTGKSVFYGWTHGTGYGLLAGDTIRRTK